MTEPLSDSLWDFSLALYDKPHVAEVCLQLQDDCGVNINLLLWSLWLETQQKQLDQVRLTEALAAIQPWDVNYVQPLRQLRRKLKQDFAADLTQIENLRQQIKAAELQAEQQLQLCLERLALDWSQAQQAMPKNGNLVFYLQYLKLPSGTIAQAVLSCGA